MLVSGQLLLSLSAQQLPSSLAVYAHGNRHLHAAVLVFGVYGEPA